MKPHQLFSLLLVISITPQLRGQAWTPLFDGHSFSGWTTSDGNPVQTGGWSIIDGSLHLDRNNGRGGNLVTQREYGDFELIFDWKIPQGANNGIKYRVQDFDGRLLGCEYQIIDDEGHGNLPPKGKTGTLYALYETLPHQALRPPGQWNRGRILVCGNRIEHWLNGRLVVEAEAGSPEWEARVAQSKFHDVEGFGRNRYGKIMLTDHGDEIWLRNLFVRDLGSIQVSSGACRVVCASEYACGQPHWPRRRTFRRLLGRHCR